jgi:hypothetical protein
MCLPEKPVVLPAVGTGYGAAVTLTSLLLEVTGCAFAAVLRPSWLAMPLKPLGPFGRPGASSMIRRVAARPPPAPRKRTVWTAAEPATFCGTRGS